MILLVDRILCAYFRQLSVQKPCCEKSPNIDDPVLTNKYVKPVMHVIRLRTPSVLSDITSTSANNAPYLHISIMATKLERGVDLPVNLSAGMIIAFKSRRFDLTTTEGALKGGPQATLNLYNKNNDIILCINIRRGKNKVFFNDFARKSLVDGWGQPRSVDLSPVDIEKWQRSGVTISIHDCSTRSEQRYQILFDLTTMCYFDAHLPGPAIKANYREAPEDTSRPLLSDPLKVVFYLLKDLSPKEKQAIVSGRQAVLWSTIFYRS